MPCGCNTAGCPGNGGGYYVTARDAGRTAFLLGPYDEHAAALANVARGRTLAEKADPWAFFYWIGTARVREAPLPVARFGQ